MEASAVGKGGEVYEGRHLDREGEPDGRQHRVLEQPQVPGAVVEDAADKDVERPIDEEG